MKFNIGDKVIINRKLCYRKMVDEPWAESAMTMVQSGKIYTVSEIPAEGDKVKLREDPSRWWWYDDEISLTTVDLFENNLFTI